MSYEVAKERFEENLRVLVAAKVKDQPHDPLAWNLNSGLALLADAIQQDLTKTHNLLASLLRELRKKKR